MEVSVSNSGINFYTKTRRKKTHGLEIIVVVVCDSHEGSLVRPTAYENKNNVRLEIVYNPKDQHGFLSHSQKSFF